MSVAGYFRSAKGWLALLLVVPLLSGALAGAYVAAQPTTYAVTALVPIEIPSGSNAVQTTAAFRKTFTSDQVVDRVGSEFNVPSDEVSGGLSAIAASSGSSPSPLVNVRYETATADQADAILVGAVVASRQTLFAGPLALAESNVAQAEAAFAAATTAAQEAGLPEADAALKAAERRLAALQGRADQNGLAESIAEAEAAAVQARLRLTELSAVSETQSSAKSILETARRTLTTTQAQLASAANPETVVVSAPREMDRTLQIVRAAVSGALIGLLVAGAIVAGITVARIGPSSIEAASDDAPGAETADKSLV